MKIEQFEDAITEDLAWRKMEISQLFRILNDANSKDVILKSIILLLYAHWEGFIKKSSKYYLKYISESKVKIKDLTLNFKAITLKHYAAECIDNDGFNLAKEIAFINKQSRMEEKKFKIEVNVDNDLDEDIINTKHNLNSKVLKNITGILGTKYNAAMHTRSNYIDAQLLYNRNTIGHGSKLKGEEVGEKNLEFDEIVHLKDFVLIMLDYYAQILMDYAINKFYLSANSDLRDDYENKKEEELLRNLDELENRISGIKEIESNGSELSNSNT